MQCSIPEWILEWKDISGKLVKHRAWWLMYYTSVCFGDLTTYPNSMLKWKKLSKDSIWNLSAPSL